MKNIKIVSLLVVLVFVFIGLVGCSGAKKDISGKDTKATTMNVGKKAPNFELKDTTLKVHKLSDYAGKKVYIKFWASWCSICLAGLDEVDTLASKNNDFVVLSVVSPGFRGEQSSQGFTKWFNSLNKKNLTVLLDEQGVLSNKLEVRGYPTSIFIGSDGVIVKTQPGQKSNKEIQKTFQSIK